MLLVAAAAIWAVFTTPGLSLGVSNPGLRVAFTAKGLDYGRQVGITILEASLHDLKIPDLTGPYHVHMDGVQCADTEPHHTYVQSHSQQQRADAEGLWNFGHNGGTHQRQ